MVAAAAGDAAARHRAGRLLRTLPRGLALHRLPLALAERCGRLAGRCGLLQQCRLLPGIPRRASQAHPGPGARPRARPEPAAQPWALSMARLGPAILALESDRMGTRLNSSH